MLNSFSPTTSRLSDSSSPDRIVDDPPLASPDNGDALALTFAYPLAQRSDAEERRIEELFRGLKRRVV